MSNTYWRTVFLALASGVIAGCGSSNGNSGNAGASTPPPSNAARSFAAGQADVTAAQNQPINHTAGAAKNIILFVGDGMGVSTVTAARILQGQRAGNPGEENVLSFGQFPFAALSKTYNTNQQTPDSAGTMTAMMTGVKSKAGVLSVAPDVARADCASSRGRELVTALELAEIAGKATGVVTTARLTHATPGATYAHTPERNWESDDELTAEAKANGCKDIADQFVAFDSGDGIDVAFGGGRRHFLPDSVTDVEGKSGRRSDGRDLTAEWQAKYSDGVYIETKAEFDALDATTAGHIFGLFNSSHMQYEADRGNDVAGEPSLSEMTGKAIDRLQQNPNGYFLMVESGRIDHAHHAGNAFNALNDTIEFSHAVQAAVDKVSLEDTLIIVTADHSHVFTIAGYPTRGNPILGKVVENDGSGLPKTAAQLADDDLPFTTVGYTNGLGFADLGQQTDADARYALPIDAGRKDLTAIDTQTPGYHQEALVPLASETHAGEDVGIYAAGPDADLFNGTLEQNVIYHVMNRAGNLEAGAQAAP